MKPTLAILALATPALADGQLRGTATWLWDVTTQDGDAIVEPGETASVTLTLLMEPNLGDAEYVGLGLALFDTLGDANAHNGQILGWQYHYNLHDLYGDLTTTDGVNLYNTHAGQLAGAFTGPFTDANPIDVLTFEWQPLAGGSYDVAYVTDSYADGAPTAQVWEFLDDDETLVTYPVTEATVTFTVVPAPAALLPLLLVARRCRPLRAEPRPSGRGRAQHAKGRLMGVTHQ